MKLTRRGMILVISGPSGSGKSSIYKESFKTLKGIEFSVSCTTRAPRSGEQDGIDYHFSTKEEFEARIVREEFAEYAQVHGNYYGTLKSELMKRIDNGIDVLLDIDVQGAAKLRRLAETDPAFRGVLEFVFIAPPSAEELERRLRARGTESPESLEKRLTNAKQEMQQWHLYDYLLVNDDLQQAAAQFCALTRTLRLSAKRLKPQE